MAFIFYKLLKKEKVMKKLMMVIFIVLCWLQPVFGEDQKTLASFQFNGNADDAAGNSTIYLSNTSFYSNAYLEIDGNYGDYTATAAINGLDYHNFTLFLDFRPLDFSGSKINVITGGRGYRWIGFEHNSDGNLLLTLNNGDIKKDTGLPLSVKEWHYLICSVAFGNDYALITVMLNGAVYETMVPDFEFNAFGLEDEKEFCFVNYSWGGIFNGYVDNFRVYNWGMSKSEMEVLYNVSSHLTSSKYCTILGDDLSLTVPWVTYYGLKFGAKLDYYSNPADPGGIYFKVDLNSIKIK